jgi:hypothetical protein
VFLGPGNYKFYNNLKVNITDLGKTKLNDIGNSLEIGKMCFKSIVKKIIFINFPFLILLYFIFTK